MRAQFRSPPTAVRNIGVNRVTMTLINTWTERTGMFGTLAGPSGRALVADMPARSFWDVGWLLARGAKAVKKNFLDLSRNESHRCRRPRGLIRENCHEV